MTDMENAPAAKLTYSEPKLELYGTFEDLTKAHSAFNVTDGAYPADTPLAGHTS